MSEPLDILFVIGCTGSGKGSLGRAIADRVDGEIISVDSMKVYRRMDIGTAKPSEAILSKIPHHLVNIREPSDEFSVAEFVALAEDAARDIAGRGKKVLAVGGTALYIKAWSEGLFEGPSANEEIRDRLRSRATQEGNPALHKDLTRVDPLAAERIHPNDLRRIVRAMEVFEITGTPISELQRQWDRERTKHRCAFVGIRRKMEDQSHRTNMRVKRLVEMGWADECRALLAESTPLSTSARQALGYREMFDYIEGSLTLEDAVEQIKIGTRRFSKSQRTWFKRFRGAHWFDVQADASVESVTERVMATWPTLYSM